MGVDNNDDTKQPKKEFPAPVETNKTTTLLLPQYGDSQDSNWQRWFDRSMGMPPVRKGSHVIGLIDGKETFVSMVSAINTANNDSHFIYMLNWYIDLDFELIPGTPGTKLFDLLTNAVNKGVQVRAMIWDDATIIQGNWNTTQVRRINGIPNNTKLDARGTSNVVGSAAAILDNNTLNLGCHHQKILIVMGELDLIAFCGGVEFNQDRIAQLKRQPGSPMHDVHCRIDGPAAGDLLNIFLQRWDDHKESANIDTQKGGLRCTAVPKISETGDKYIQIGRTFGNGLKHTGIDGKYGKFYKFAQPGEKTAEKMILHAIGRAQQFIYIEDQYLISMSVSQKLREQLPHIKNLIILIPHSSISDHLGIWNFRKKFVDNLKSDPSTCKKVAICYRTGRFTPIDPKKVPPDTPHAYIHAKIFIIDDKFAIIGSANCNNRGYTHDSEVVAGIFDEAGDGNLHFAHELRMRLWKEHLESTDDAVFSPGLCAHRWYSNINRYIAVYDQNAVTDNFPPPIEYVDPDGS